MNTHKILALKSLSFLRYDLLNNLALPPFFTRYNYWVGEFLATSETNISKSGKNIPMKIDTYDDWHPNYCLCYTGLQKPTFVLT